MNVRKKSLDPNVRKGIINSVRSRTFGMTFVHRTVVEILTEEDQINKDSVTGKEFLDKKSGFISKFLT